MKRFFRSSPVVVLSIISVLVACFVFHSVSYAQSKKEEWDQASVLFNEGYKRYDLSDFRGAIEKWESALSIFQKTGAKQAIGATTGALGSAYKDLGDYRKAISYYEQALAIAQEIGDRQNKGAWLGNLGLVYETLGDYRKAISYLEQSLSILTEMGDKRGRGACLGNLGLAHMALGDYRKALSYYRQALAVAEETKNRLGKSRQLGNLGLAYSELGDYRRAIDYYEQALAIAEAIGNKQGKGTWIGNLGIVHIQLGDYRKAVTYFEQALAIDEEIGNKEGKSRQLGSMGGAYIHLGDYRKAISYYEKALAIAEEMGDKRGKGTWISNLGLAYSSMGDYQKAILYFEKAITIDKEIGRSYGNREGNLADTYLALDRDDEAFIIYTKQNHSIRLGRYFLKKKDFRMSKEQFDLDREKDEKAKRAEFIIARWIGLGLSNEGLRDYDKAYEWYKKALDFMEEQREALSPADREHFFGGNIFGFPRIEAYEGAVRCAFMLNRLDDVFFWAENTRGRVLSELLSRRHSGESHKIPLKLATEEEELTTQIRINKKQQQTAFQKNNPELLKQAEDEYPPLKQKIESLIDRLRKEYPQYASVKYPQPVKLSQLAMKKGETIIEYEVTEPYTIGLVIREGNILKAFKIDKTRKELETLVNQFRTPFQEGHSLNEYRLAPAKEMADLILNSALSVLAKGERLIIIPDEFLSLIPFESLLLSAPVEVMREEVTVLAKTKTQTEEGVVDKRAIIRGLSQTPATRGKGATAAPRVTTHILFDTGSAQIRKESQKQINEIVAALKAAEIEKATVRIEGHTDSTGDPRYNLKLSYKRAQAVYEYLVKNGITQNRLSYTGKGDTESLADNTTDKGRRINRRVDFVRVTDKTQPSSLKGIVYAMDAYPISYYQSASVLSLHRGLHIERTKEKTFFGLGDPVYDTHDNRSTGLRSVAIVKKPSSDVAPQVADTQDEGYRFARLVNTEKEVNEVGKLFTQSRILTGVNASEEKMKAENLKQHRYILFSTHGILGNEIPYIKQPALVLNLIGNEKEDGFLTALEIFNLECNADIIVLSACQTGLGIQSAGEGVVGLSRAFMYAGTDTVLVSLWSVADESTYKLMVRFFEGLKGGKDKLTALSDAKNYLRANGYDNPFYWAPFILMGESN